MQDSLKSNLVSKLNFRSGILQDKNDLGLEDLNHFLIYIYIDSIYIKLAHHLEFYLLKMRTISDQSQSPTTGTPLVSCSCTT